MAVAAFSPRPAVAVLSLQSWTFERPSYGALTRNIADHYLVKQNGLWHLFYTNLSMPADSVQYIGHAVSTDLVTWTEHAPVITASPDAPDWRSQAVWAPMVASLPSGGWVMAYTGVSSMATQRIGFLTSDDLETWTPLADSLPFEPDSARYAWTATAYSSARDPHLVYQNGIWHMLYCVRRIDGMPSIGHAESADLVSWTHDDPLLIQGTGWVSPDIESPGVTFFGGKTYLYWAQFANTVAQGDSLLDNWAQIPSTVLPAGSAPELIPNGNGLLMSRRRLSLCNNFQTFVWFDTLDTSIYPFKAIPPNPIAGFTVLSGDAFVGQPSFGDGQADRGEVPADPSGMYWMSSREFVPEPGAPYTCGEQRGPEKTGLVTSDPFVLDGDSLAVAIQGANSPDSAYVELRDECTQTTITRFSGGSDMLTPMSAYVGNARGRTVTVRIADQLTRPGGWIGVDDLGERASAGLGDPPAPPIVTWTAPAGGENLQRKKPFRIRYNVTGGGTVDSLVLYLTDPSTSVLLRQLTLAVGSTNTNWVTPDTLLYLARLRIVAYAHSGAWGCATSNTFEIGAPTGVDLGALGGLLRVSYDASGARLEGRVAALPEEGVLEIYDLRGRRVATPWRGHDGQSFAFTMARGDDGRRLAPGLYFARLRQADLVWQAKFVQFR
ncbi:MAG TPA: hypothetical protein VGR66_11310 [Candidatus Eisenbacteria bacterium]|nr:hypothetical protein [Candidatus Eisenbacteria bacterium]